MTATVLIALVVVHPVRSGLAEGAKPAATEILGWTTNDAFAIIRDGNRRSDEGATAGIGFGITVNREPFAVNADLAYYMFTQRNGPLRTEWLILRTALVESMPGGEYFDRVRFSTGVGLQINGDLGGADVQNLLHRITPTQNDLTFDTGLQSTYTNGFRLSPELNVEVQAERRFGLVQVGLGADAVVPVGPTGLVWIGGTLRTRIGHPRGLYAQPALQLRLQQALGDVFDFLGAPVDGGVAIPSLAVGWSELRWAAALRWERNHLGTSRGFGGDRDGESVEMRFSFGWD